MATPALHRLMNLLLLHRKGELGVKGEDLRIEKTNDQALLDLLTNEKFLKELFDCWGSYLYEGKGLEEAFFGKPRRGLGTYSQRLKKLEAGRHKLSLFLELLHFEKYPDFWVANRSKTIREQIARSVSGENKVLVDGPFESTESLWSGTLRELESLEREYRTWRKQHSLPSEIQAIGDPKNSES